MSEFFTSLVERTVTPITPEGFITEEMKALPHGVVYQIHTVYLKEGLPVAIAEKIDALTNLTQNSPELFAEAPDSVEIYLLHLDRLWRLLR